MKRYILCVFVVLMMGVLLFTACSQQNTMAAQEPKDVAIQESRIDKLKLDSEVLGKAMNIHVYVPIGYNSKEKYPVLYLFHGFGGGDNQYQWIPGVVSQEKADEMITKGQINPMIIVSPQYNASLGYNSSNEKAYVDSKTKFAYGRYEDYICQELIPYIDANYSTKSSKEWRYAGGFSGGGNTALFLGFKHDDLFSKIGAHCPGINVDEQLEAYPELKQFMYPTEEARKDRDPIYLAQEKDLSDRKIYIDVVKNDRWIRGGEKLYQVLKEKGMNVQYYVNEGEHDPSYLRENVEKYLIFYGGKE